MAELFAGKTLFRNGSEGSVDPVVLKDKIVAIYFSGHWCPPCRGFTPLLKNFYEELSASGEFEVIFVSSDYSDEDLQHPRFNLQRGDTVLLLYLKESHGTWLYLGFGDAFIQELKKKYEIRGIPALIVVKADGTVITKDGRAEVMKKAPTQALAGWKSS